MTEYTHAERRLYGWRHYSTIFHPNEPGEIRDPTPEGRRNFELYIEGRKLRTIRFDLYHPKESENPR